MYRTVSIRHVVTDWALRTGRKSGPTFADTRLAAPADAAHIEVERLIATRKHLRYCDYMTAQRSD